MNIKISSGGPTEGHHIEAEVSLEKGRVTIIFQKSRFLDDKGNPTHAHIEYATVEGYTTFVLPNTQPNNIPLNYFQEEIYINGKFGIGLTQANMIEYDHANKDRVSKQSDFILAEDVQVGKNHLLPKVRKAIEEHEATSFAVQIRKKGVQKPIVLCRVSCRIIWYGAHSSKDQWILAVNID